MGWSCKIEFLAYFPQKSSDHDDNDDACESRHGKNNSDDDYYQDDDDGECIVRACRKLTSLAV